MNTFLHTFGHLLADAAPALGTALVLAALVETLLRRKSFEKILASLVSKPFWMLSVGAVLPGCAMSSLPMAVVLRRAGAPAGSVAAFMLMAAILGPSGVLMTGFLIGWDMAGSRVLWPFLVLWPLALLLNRLPGANSQPLPASQLTSETRGCHDDSCGNTGHEADTFLRNWGKSLFGMVRVLLPILLAGLAITALLQVWLPEDAIGEQLGTGWPAYVLAALAGLPLYVCEGGEAALGWMLLEVGVAPGVVFTFLLAAAGTCLPTLLSALRIIGWKFTIGSALYWWMAAIVGGWAFTALFGS